MTANVFKISNPDTTTFSRCGDVHLRMSILGITRLLGPRALLSLHQTTRELCIPASHSLCSSHAGSCQDFYPTQGWKQRSFLEDTQTREVEHGEGTQNLRNLTEQQQPGLARNFARSMSSIPYSGSQCLHCWTSPTPPENYKNVHLYAAKRQFPGSIGDCERRLHEYTDWKRHRPVLQSESSPLEERY